MPKHVAKWTLLMILARIAALRIPSEVFTMRWHDIDWNKKRLLIHCIKTEHHAKHATRTVPMFPLIEANLVQHRISQSKSGKHDPAGKVFPDIDADTNLRTRFE
jgi:integrase